MQYLCKKNFKNIIMKRIIGIGNALIDILSRIESDDLLRQMNLPKGSMQLLDDERYREISATLARMDTQRATGGPATPCWPWPSWAKNRP